MSTYADMQARLADQLLSSALVSTDQIKQAIQDAIKKYERLPFYFNGQQGTNSFNTVVGQEFYTSSDSALIGTMSQFDRVSIRVANNRYSLKPRTWGFIQDLSVNNAVTGLPTDYAYFAEQMRMYPIPNQVYPITLVGTYRPAALSGDTDTNAWTNDAEPLIRNCALRIIHRDITLDQDKMQLAAQAELEALADVRGETTRRQGASGIRPTQF